MNKKTKKFIELNLLGYFLFVIGALIAFSNGIFTVTITGGVIGNIICFIGALYIYRGLKLFIEKTKKIGYDLFRWYKKFKKFFAGKTQYLLFVLTPMIVVIAIPAMMITGVCNSFNGFCKLFKGGL